MPWGFSTQPPQRLFPLLPLFALADCCVISFGLSYCRQHFGTVTRPGSPEADRETDGGNKAQLPPTSFTPARPCY